MLLKFIKLGIIQTTFDMESERQDQPRINLLSLIEMLHIKKQSLLIRQMVIIFHPIVQSALLDPFLFLTDLPDALKCLQNLI